MALQMACPGRGTVYRYHVLDDHLDPVGAGDFATMIDVIEHPLLDKAHWVHEPGCSSGSIFLLNRIRRGRVAAP